jgi:hypothetical protein
MMAELDGDDAPVMQSGVGTGISLDGGRLVIQRAQDVEPIIEHVAALRQMGNGKSKSGELVHIGEIPDVIVESYMNEVGIDFGEFVRNPVHIKRIMQDPNYAKFRVFQGAI